MVEKDYYKILEVSPAATAIEIKKSYRRLALKYHPDKNFGNNIFEAKFKEIQEAYDTLSDDRKRHEYNEKRSRRTYTSTFTNKKPPTPVTPQSILNQTVEFRRKVAVLDPDRMNKVALFQQIELLLSPSNISLLQQLNDRRLSKKMIDEILYCARFLPFVYVEKICFLLTRLAGTDNTLYHKIYQFSRKVKRENYWNKYKVLAAILISITLCIVIYFLSIDI
ncbi:MAG: hypothetical protein JWQ96_2621 [Segetibacter sp.]|nr:hypothetical protein [Segetibacter sp.]